MKVKVFSVFDSKVEAFLPPFFAPTRGAAIRSFTVAIGDPSHSFARHPGDYCLFELGEFDDSSGVLIPAKVPVSLGLAQEFMGGAVNGNVEVRV